MLIKKNDEQNKKNLGFSNEALEAFDFVYSIILIINKEGIVVFINRRGCDVLQCDKSEVIGKNWVDNFLPKRHQTEVAKLRLVVLSNKDAEIIQLNENPVLISTGEEHIILWHNKVIKDMKGTSIGTLSAGQDITTQRKAMDSLWIKNLVFDVSLAANSIADSNGNITEANNMFARIWGYPRSEIIGKSILQFFGNKDDAVAVINALDEDGSWTGEYVAKKKDGSTFAAQTLASVINDKDDKLIGYQSSVFDITKRKKMYEEIKRFKTISDNAVHGILITDIQGNIIYINDYFAHTHGYETNELIGKNRSIFHKEVHLDVYNSVNDSLLKNGFFNSVEVMHSHKDGTEIPILENGVVIKDGNGLPLYLAFAVSNLTKLKKLEKDNLVMETHLKHRQKLESIGTLAGGVAHEINNPINGIMNYAQLLFDSSETDSEVSEYSKEILFETERIAKIVKNLLQFSRNDKQKHSYANPADIINSTLSLIKTVIKHDQIDLQIDIPEDLPKIKCRSQQIQQVIMNLITNARDALNEKYEGYHEDKILRLYCEQFNKEKRRWIRITVEDHGNGIPEAIKEKIFEPFFTSKSRDKGTGLGLSISYGIIKDHHGELTFETKEGQYTKFYLDLPVDNGWGHEK